VRLEPFCDDLLAVLDLAGAGERGFDGDEADLGARSGEAGHGSEDSDVRAAVELFRDERGRR
jgi:hypothetical protein